MPVYKEIQVNVKVSPEAILGGLMGGTNSIHAEQTSQIETEESEK